MTKLIVIVDDEESIIDILSVILQKNDYEVMTANNGKDALELLEGIDFNFDLLITDIVMPKMNGHELVQEIIDRSIKKPILFISGYNTESKVNHLIQQYEFVEYQSKPFSIDEILGHVTTLTNH